MHAISTLVNVSEGGTSFTTVANEVLDIRIPTHPRLGSLFTLFIFSHPPSKTQDLFPFTVPVVSKCTYITGFPGNNIITGSLLLGGWYIATDYAFPKFPATT